MGSTRAPVLLQVLRPMTTALIVLHAVLAWLLFTGPGVLPTPGRTVAAVALLALWYAHAAAVNDLSDVEVDRVNLERSDARRFRPLVNQSSSPARMWLLVAILSVAVILLGLVVTPWLALTSGVMLLLNGAYSLHPFRWSARGAVAQVTLPLGYVAFPAVVAAAVATSSTGGADGRVDPVGIVVLAGLTVLFGGRLFLKDIRDEVGDRATGKRTFLVRHGLRPTLWASAIGILTGVVISGTAMTIQLDRWSPLLTLTAVAVAALVLWGLRQVAAARTLEHQLLWVGFVGRMATAWLFSCLLLVAAQSARLPVWQGELLVGLGLLLFGFGGVRFLEELRSDPRPEPAP